MCLFDQQKLYYTSVPLHALAKNALWKKTWWNGHTYRSMTSLGTFLLGMIHLRFGRGSIVYPHAWSPYTGWKCWLVGQMVSQFCNLSIFVHWLLVVYISTRNCLKIWSLHVPWFMRVIIFPMNAKQTWQNFGKDPGTSSLYHPYINPTRNQVVNQLSYHKTPANFHVPWINHHCSPCFMGKSPIVHG